MDSGHFRGHRLTAQRPAWIRFRLFAEWETSTRSRATIVRWLAGPYVGGAVGAVSGVWPAAAPELLLALDRRKSRAGQRDQAGAPRRQSPRGSAVDQSSFPNRRRLKVGHRLAVV